MGDLVEGQAMSGSKRKLEALEAEEKELEALLQQVRTKKTAVRKLLGEMSAEEKPCESFSDAVTKTPRMDVATILKLKRFDTPTISNGLECITRDRDYGLKGFNLERVFDHMPDWGTLVGYAITVKIQPSDRVVVNQKGANRQKFVDYVAQLPGGLPKIAVVEDMDTSGSGGRFCYGSMWGEVNANLFSKLGVKGCITDGAVRDLPEMQAAGFRAFSRTLSPSHSYGGVPLEWDVPVRVFGCEVRSGDLIAADRHGFQVIPRDLEGTILQAAEDGDTWERDFTIEASFAGAGLTFAEVNERMSASRAKFGQAKNQKYGSFADRMGKDWART